MKLNIVIMTKDQPDACRLIGRIANQVNSGDTVYLLDNVSSHYHLQYLESFAKVYPFIQIISEPIGIGLFANYKNSLLNRFGPGEWFVWLDSDEWVREGFLDFIRGLIERKSPDAVRLARINIIGDAPQLSEVDYANAAKLYQAYPDFQTRVMLNTPGIRFQFAVHEEVRGYRNAVNTTDPLGTIIHLRRKTSQRFEEIELSNIAQAFVRPDLPSFDRGILREVITDNCYRLPSAFDNYDAVIDIGAHIGFFCLAAIGRGAKNIHAFEAEPRNYARLHENLSRFSECVRVKNLAVWRSDKKVDNLNMVVFDENNPSTNTGGNTAVLGNGTTPVKTIGLDTILSEVGRVGFLKMDCEGSEYPILYTCTKLDQVKHMAIEFHDGFAFGPHAVVDGFKNTGEDLAEFLKIKGFNVEIKHTAHDMGIIYANRP